MSFVIHQEMIVSVPEPKVWEMEGKTGIIHKIQTQFINEDGSLGTRFIKIDPKMRDICKGLLNKSVNVVVNAFAKSNRNGPYIDFKAVTAPTAVAAR
ncbi:MAG: hypothetical protein ACI9VI_003536 [Candidatus Azotimanducaceae bacterium]|jgi:hypothetical protein